MKISIDNIKMKIFIKILRARKYIILLNLKSY